MIQNIRHESERQTETERKTPSEYLCVCERERNVSVRRGFEHDCRRGSLVFFN